MKPLIVPPGLISETRMTAIFPSQAGGAWAKIGAVSRASHAVRVRRLGIWMIIRAKRLDWDCLFGYVSLSNGEERA
jgi:hypothetical protein